MRARAWGAIGGAAGTALAAASPDGSAPAAGPQPGAAVTSAASTTDPAAPSAPASTDAQTSTSAAAETTTTVADEPMRDGAQRLHFEVGPIDIEPGQNNIDFKAGIPQPDVDGWIVRMRPDLRLADGTVPPVDVIHLHHGVWLNTSRRDSTAHVPERLLAAGEEKTVTAFPAPYAYNYVTTDKWTLNFMLHNLLPSKTQVWITYDLDFIAGDSSAATGIVPVRPIWMDVENGK